MRILLAKVRNTCEIEKKLIIFTILGGVAYPCITLRYSNYFFSITVSVFISMGISIPIVVMLPFIF